MSPVCLFLIELIEIWRAVQRRNDELGEFIGGDSSFLEREIERLLKVILDLSGATIKENEYHDALVAQGAANIAWNCLEDIGFHLDLPAENLATWLLDYAEGRIAYKSAAEAVTNCPDHAELVGEYGFLLPRKEHKPRSD